MGLNEYMKIILIPLTRREELASVRKIAPPPTKRFRDKKNDYRRNKMKGFTE